jgi:hypothetical protein
MYATFEHPKHFGKRERYRLLADHTLEVITETTTDVDEDGWHPQHRRRISVNMAPLAIRRLLGLTNE